MAGARHGMCELTQHGMGAAWIVSISLKVIRGIISTLKISPNACVFIEQHTHVTNRYPVFRRRMILEGLFPAERTKVLRGAKYGISYSRR
jgi:hypothetical protein